MFELAQLRCFVEVARELHFGRAAQRLNMTQPPLSRQIQMLERELKASLFERTSRSVVLTPAGRVFLVEAKAILERSEEAAKIVRDAAKTARGQLKIGIVAATTYSLLPGIVVRAREVLPHVDLAFEELTSIEQPEALSFSRIDVGIARPITCPDGINSRCIMRGGFSLALPLDHPLARRRRPTLEQLHGERFIMYSEGGRYMRDLLLAAFKMSSVRPLYVQHMAQAQAILSLVSTGLGIGVVPEETRNACFDNVVFRPIKLGPSIAAEFHALWRPANRNPALSPFLDLIEPP
ncbi:LysR family transcriptional regulator [Methylobacterium mesophilicum SR1.6/6]|uniref:LysR family transcriptional regulator n=1 Tax=Methylobacterium mesophilicum SR1.6/6 TaxID=908290 RepID=A0A6B9FFL2_9HYPH|nr:LysR family transcriptional regulator [Methylobacterium mesophilicum]QGY00856.1 LysR family transcriptional regulator [Methylobacterium mesophilicum SR1.6/6]